MVTKEERLLIASPNNKKGSVWKLSPTQDPLANDYGGDAEMKQVPSRLQQASLLGPLMCIWVQWTAWFSVVQPSMLAHNLAHGQATRGLPEAAIATRSCDF